VFTLTNFQVGIVVKQEIKSFFVPDSSALMVWTLFEHPSAIFAYVAQCTRKKTMSDFSELISFKKDREEMRTESVYYVQHRNKRSVLDQELVITGDLAFRTYKASMEMKDFPKCGSEREAALKLAEWMQRMAAAIENYWSEP
jgi:hypothetical protein